MLANPAFANIRTKAAIGTVVEEPPMAVERSYTVVLIPEPEVGGFSVSVPAISKNPFLEGFQAVASVTEIIATN